MSATVGCSRCDRKFTRGQIKQGLLELETMTCGYCYAEMQSAPHQISCFGKPTEVLASGRRLLGYNPNALECQVYCPDRKVCARVMKGSK